jgi:hypothetical protein
VAKHPDDFLCEFLADHEELDEKLLEQAVRSIKKRLKKPTMTWNQIFENYERNGLKRTVEYLRLIIPASEVIEDNASGTAVLSESKDDSNEQLFQEQLQKLRDKKNQN